MGKKKSIAIMTNFKILIMDNSLLNSATAEGSERQLANSWSIWEKYQTTFLQNSANYEDNMEVIFTFSTLHNFASLWKYTTYKCPAELLYDLNTRSSKSFKLHEEDEEVKIVDGLYLFKDTIKPKWEDERNTRGCSLSCELQNLDSRSINKVWKDMLFAIVGENFPYSEQINGFRLLDRLKKYNIIKVELWLANGVQGYKQGSEESSKHAQMVEKITEHFSSLINKTQSISVHQIIKKEHFIASKVN